MSKEGEGASVSRRKEGGMGKEGKEGEGGEEAKGGGGGQGRGIKDEGEEEGGEMRADTVKAEFP